MYKSIGNKYQACKFKGYKHKKVDIYPKMFVFQIAYYSKYVLQFDSLDSSMIYGFLVNILVTLRFPHEWKLLEENLISFLYSNGGTNVVVTKSLRPVGNKNASP